MFFVFGRVYAGIFGCSSAVADMVSSGFRLYAITFLVMGYDVINSMYFTSCGDAKSSALISSLRGIVLILAFTLILPGNTRNDRRLADSTVYGNLDGNRFGMASHKAKKKDSNGRVNEHER